MGEVKLARRASFLNIILLAAIAGLIILAFTSLPITKAQDQTLETQIEVVYEDGSREVITSSVIPMKLFHSDKAITDIYVKPIVRFYYKGELETVKIDYKLDVKIASAPGEFPYNNPVTIITKTNSYTPITDSIKTWDVEDYKKAEVNLPAIHITASELENAILQKWGNYVGEINVAFYVTATVTATFTDGTTDSGSASGYTIVTFTRPEDGDLMSVEVSVGFQVNEVTNTGGSGGGGEPIAPIDVPYIILG